MRLISRDGRVGFLAVTVHFIALGAFVPPAWGSEPDAGKSRVKPVIEELTGAKALHVIPGTSAVAGSAAREVVLGGEIEYGDRIKTGDKVSATVLYPDDSRLSVLPNSDVEVEPKVENAQWNRLREGVVRGVITKAKEGADNHKPRFVIRTKSAAMGVRGTDFVMALAAGANSAKVNTLEGVVEVAKDEMSLLSGNGTPVSAGNFVSSSVGEGVGKLQAFDKVQFLKEFEAAKAGAVPQAAGAAGAGAPAASAASAAGSALGSGMGLPSLSAPSVAPLSIPPSIKPPEVPPLPPALAAASGPKDKKDEENNDRKVNLLAFQAGGFFAVDLNKNAVRAVTASWNPEIPIPYTGILSVRGHIGGDFALQGSFNSHFLVYEAQAFGVVTLFRTLYAEVGLGTQYWKEEGWHGGMASANVGLHIMKTGPLRYVFAGRSWLGAANGDPLIDQYRAGIGIVLW